MTLSIVEFIVYNVQLLINSDAYILEEGGLNHFKRDGIDPSFLAGL